MAFRVPRCVRVCVCVLFVSVPWWPLSCIYGSCVGVAALAGPGAGVDPVVAFRGSVFRCVLVSSRFRSQSSKTHWECLRDTPSDKTGESATRQNQRRRSSELSAHQLGRHPFCEVYAIRDIMARVSFLLVPLSPRSLLRTQLVLGYHGRWLQDLY